MDKGRGRGKGEKRDRPRSPVIIGDKPREVPDSDKEMQDSNDSFEDSVEDNSAINVIPKQSTSVKTSINSFNVIEEEQKGIRIKNKSLPDSQGINNKLDSINIRDTARSSLNNLEIFYNIDGKFKNKNEMSADRLSDLINNKRSRFEDLAKGEYKVTCKLATDQQIKEKIM